MPGVRLVQMTPEAVFIAVHEVVPETAVRGAARRSRDRKVAALQVYRRGTGRGADRLDAFAGYLDAAIFEHAVCEDDGAALETD